MKQAPTLLKSVMVAFAALLYSGQTKAQAITEDFNDITLLAGNGWSMQNLSTPVGSTNWFQGTNVAAGGPFDSYNGAANAYIGANYNNTGNTGTISNWLMMPNRTLRNGDVITFYSRKVAPDSYADRLEVRLSTNGASTNAGTNATTVGDFSTLIMSINPNLVLGVYPTVWTQYTITISGLGAPTSGRVAFRYFVTGAGLSGTNSDYIGIDAFTYTPYVCPAFTMGPGSLAGGTAGVAYNQTITQTGALGAPSFNVTAGALPPGLSLGTGSGTISGTPTATGTFNFTVTVSDASGCTGSTAYSITIACPTNGATLSSIPPQCNNGTPYILIEGSPAGGTYSGTNVSGGMFDPAGGTQTVTYTVIDPYGCTQVANGTATVNTAPTVTLSSFTAVCDNGGSVTLSGESPAGGAWSGTNVSGNTFDPSAGAQNVTYTYTDANGCFNSATQNFPVNAAPTVTLSIFGSACDNGGMVTLTGEAPAGGTWSGTNVSGNMFDPSGGTQMITYSYTDANGCTNSASQSMTVNAAPDVTLSSFTPVCDNGGSLTLSGEAPTGGTWIGTNVSGNMFDPSAGTQTIWYAFTDANGCSDTASQVFNVNAAPTVTLSSFQSACSNNGMITLTGGSPAGGSWSGTGVTGNQFDVSAGTQTIFYTYGDSMTGCSNSTSQVMTVNAAPTVTATVATTACTTDPAITLNGGSPAGGAWSGTAVTGSTFNPATAGTGNWILTYTFTDANGCTGSATDNIAVNACVGIEESAENGNISIFPNPNNGTFTISFNEPAQGKLVVSIFGVDGKLVTRDQRSDYNGSYIQNFDLSTMPKGVYLVEVQTETGRSFTKLVLQ